MNILITGGAGFVGGNLALFLKNNHSSWKIIAFDNLKRRGSELNIQRLKEAGVEFIHGDIRCKEDFFDLEKKNIEITIECSAEPSPVAGYDGNSLYVVNTNLTGLINCLEFCKKVKSNIIFMSTSRIFPYESINSIPTEETDSRFKWTKQEYSKGINENFPVTGAKTLYGATKFSGEIFTTEYASMFDFKYIINRFGVIGGPWQFGKSDQGVFSLWMLAHYFKKPLKYIGFGGKGKQVRDVLNINDVCSLIEFQINNIEPLNGEIFNAGGGYENSLSLLETTELCREITGNRINIASDLTQRKGDVKIFIANNGKVFEKTGWFPKISKTETLESIFKWIQTNENLLKNIF
jgi:CDP-paratose 2-epimerase